MKPRAFTPVFRWLDRKSQPAAAPGIQVEPAAAPGSHPGEMWFLAGATALLTATAMVPATSGLRPLWLRLPVVLALIFVVPQLIMGVVALFSHWLEGPRLSREAAQDWSCLAVMTLWAAWHSRSGGWGGAICQVWLAFVVVNGLVWIWNQWGGSPGHEGHPAATRNAQPRSINSGVESP